MAQSANMDASELARDIFNSSIIYNGGNRHRGMPAKPSVSNKNGGDADDPGALTRDARRCR